jgi:hypothetical protein|tara:strand:+ start:6222 stop:6968 length:747 start_codon:yes stop_codon:yes gene_type:complete
MKIVEFRKDQLVFQDDQGNIDAVPNNPYWRLKLKRFAGDRIYHKFNDDVDIQETYNQGIFNFRVISDGIESVVQIRVEWSDDVSTAIENEDLDTMLMIFEIHRSGGKGFQEKMLDALMNQYAGRIEVTDLGFIIDGRFMVDRHGSARVNSLYKGTGDKQKKLTDKEWKFICIVAAGVRKRKVRMPNGEEIEIDPVDEQIMRKILFLLNPNMSDRVFTNQLPSIIREELTYDDDEINHKTRKRKHAGVQ